jgi:hypothetical protein
MSLLTITAVTGAAISGLTTPVYNLTHDQAPSLNGEQYAVTSLGGTQTGVTTHSTSDPFTITFFRPKNPKSLGNPDGSGVYRNVGKNVYKCIVRKGVDVGNVRKEVELLVGEFAIPAGSDVVDAQNLKAALSLMIGALNQEADSIASLITTGLMQ